jgi:hypothetical protein
MITKIGTLAAALAVAIGAVGAALPAIAAADPHAAAAAERRAFDDIVAATVDLWDHRDKAAMDRSARAETVLLNARQSGIYHDPASLAALERAHEDFVRGRAKAAGPELMQAENALRTP